MNQPIIDITCPCCKYHYKAEEGLSFESDNILEGDQKFVAISHNKGLLEFYESDSGSENFICPKCGVWFTKPENVYENVLYE